MTDFATYNRWRDFPDEMTPGQAIEALKPLAVIGDLEVAHMQADEILCSLLRHLGHKEIVETFESIEKWYA